MLRADSDGNIGPPAELAALSTKQGVVLMGHRIAVTALACAAILSSMPTFAASASASASITNVQFTLVDLDESDGITPSLSFAWNLGPVAENYLASGSIASVALPGLRSASAFDTIESHIGVPAVSFASASVGSDYLVASAIETQAGSSRTALTMVSAGMNNGTFDDPVFSNLLMVLSPQTRLVVSADLSAASSLVCGAADQAAYNCYASAFAFFQFTGAYSFQDGRMLDVSSVDSANVLAVGTGTETLLGAITSLDNFNDETAIVSFMATAYAGSGLTGVAPIPEPSTWAMMTLGLGGLFMVGRRRRGRRDAGQADDRHP